MFWRLLWRESRGARGRLLFFTACVAVGVTAVVGVAALGDAVELGIRGHSRELLGGDLAIESRTDLGDTSRFFSPQLKAARPARLEMVTMRPEPFVFIPGATALMNRNAPLRLASTMASKSSALTSSRGRGLWPRTPPAT